LKLTDAVLLSSSAIVLNFCDDFIMHVIVK